MYETFEHPSDIGIRGVGINYHEAFSEAARCVFSIMADLPVFMKEIKVPIVAKAFNIEELLVEFINKLLSQAAINKCVFIDFEIIDIDDNHIQAFAFGEKIKAHHKNALKVEVKAATYSQLKVYQNGGKFIAECIVDV